MISGFDTVFVARGPVTQPVSRLLDKWLTRWPALRTSVEGRAGDEFCPWNPKALTLSADRVHILVARDREMEVEWDNRGYALDSLGEGPFSIAYEPCGWKTLGARLLEDPYSREGFGFVPYEATVVGAGLYMVSVVTPDAESAFSKDVLDDLVEVLYASDE